MNWQQLLCEERPGRIEYGAGGSDLRNEFEKDYHRIIVSASFRRLQDKTQVFPLDKSDFIRTRLTHSLEVSSVARSLGQIVGASIMKSGLDPAFTARQKADICDILQCAGLIHDIGNPPFGHFGEETIREWFALQLPKLSYKGKPVVSLLRPEHLADLTGFEGNAQGLRMVSKLDYPVHQDGLNLTYGVLSATLKYTASAKAASPKSRAAAGKKVGYFTSEKELFEAIQSHTGTDGRRSPLAVLLEAADDIAYATADIEDAFKKGFFNFETFRKELHQRGAAKSYRDRLSDLYDMARLSGAVDPEESAVRSWLREMQDVLIVAAADSFIEHYAELMEGSYEKELVSSRTAAVLLKALKTIAYDYAFTSMSIYKTEIAANRIMTTLLEMLVPAALLFDETQTGLMEEKYLSLIPVNYGLVCRKASDGRELSDVLYARLQMALDTVSGMTDSYARDLYTELVGIR
ncbi:MAG: deoxyguanosinetriphosphate triphosphohydrolase [Lachnospiraceae bacterium]|nr:deoxyguanosinetriphosphate triphosphohydrolase [Lachnospiraceae bacterium]